MRMDEVEFKIIGSEMQYVELELDPGEAAIGESGALLYMENGIEMETIFGDGSTSDDGMLNKVLNAGKRLITGENVFTSLFQNNDRRKQRLAFASPTPGKIVAVNLKQIGGTLHCQKDAFLCAARGVSLGLAFRKKIGVGMFGGDGFILQKLQGDGMAFVHAGGAVLERTLVPGETLRVNSGCVVAFQPTVNFDIHYVGSVKTAVFGGQGLFFATLIGPGKIWLQSMSFTRLAERINSVVVNRSSDSN